MCVWGGGGGVVGRCLHTVVSRASILTKPACSLQ